MAKNAESLRSVRKKVTHTHELIATSHHEAGHTIYALLHFMRINSVRVYQDKKTKRMDGVIFYDSPPVVSINDTELQVERLHCEIGLSYAGLIAEKYQFKLHTGSDKFPSFLNGSYNDLSEASDLIKKYQVAPPGRKRYNYKKKIIREVARELEHHWDAVTIVAHALFQKKRLNFLDLKNLLTKKTKDEEFWKERFRVISNFYENSAIDEKEFRSMLSL
jgi:hypothetical protein